MNQMNALRLKKTQLFSGLDEKELNRVAAVAEERSYHKGQTIFDEGEQAEGFYVVLEGQVKIVKLARDGREQILRVVNAGDTFAEAAALAAGVFPASAQAMQATRAAHFSTTRFRALLREEPELSVRLIATLCELLHHFVSLVEQLALREVSSRLANYLLERSAEANSITVTLDVSKSVLAARLGAVSETLSRTLRKLRDDKVIEVKGKTIILLNHNALDDLATGINS
jgi:CRP/FNR family transcriptional regulator, dissimilatory nitrate respiration regulator